MKKNKASKEPKHLHASDLRDIAQLLNQATTGVTRITEGVHQSVWGSMGIPGGKTQGKTRGITGLTYKMIYGITEKVGEGVDVALKKGVPSLKTDEESSSLKRDIILSALNGFIGDRLKKNNNALAVQMDFRYQQQTLDCHAPLSIPRASKKVLVLIHGLCMTDQQWASEVQGKPFNHGEAISSKLEYSPVYLRYNTGLHISENGRELSLKLEQLCKHWPNAIEELAVIGYSMGGLLIRSAIHYAREARLAWPDYLKQVVFIGTPHHGAPLARASSWLDFILDATPYTRPFIPVGQLRSEGMMDLRHGNLVDEDWKNIEPFDRSPDNRHVLALPDGVACHTIAATRATQNSRLENHWLGDGLVPLQSALGQHEHRDKSLAFEQSSQRIMYEMNHLDLLRSPDVTQQITSFLTKA